jgi:hypothetical protein
MCAALKLLDVQGICVALLNLRIGSGRRTLS